MSPSRRLARTLLATVFVSEGVNALRQQGRLTEQVKQSGLVDQLPAQVPASLRTPENVVRATAAIDVLGGIALLRSTTPRLASLGLIGGLLPMTAMAHPFWQEKDKHVKAEQRQQFLLKLGLVGGLLLSAADTGGRESVPHAVGRLSRRASKRAANALPTAA